MLSGLREAVRALAMLAGDDEEAAAAAAAQVDAGGARARKRVRLYAFGSWAFHFPVAATLKGYVGAS